VSTEAVATFAIGTRVHARGDAWIVRAITPHDDCRSLRLEGCGAANRGVTRTLLLPFDRPRLLRPSSRIRAVKRRRWARRIRDILSATHPFGGLRAAVDGEHELLPFQLEPALAMLRHARLRILIADEVGLGKTIQACFVLNELAAVDTDFRALVVTPAGIREQWHGELKARFALQSIVADTAWLAASSRDLPPDVNPWSLPGIYVASLDLVKRPEVLRALEDVTWDALVIDEVHGAGPGTARLAAAHALGARARRIILLTATPPDGDPAHFAAIASIGESSGVPLTEFRRSREVAGIPARRKSILLPVRLSEPECEMHRLLERYTSLVWQEARGRSDPRARLAAIVLRKRALSSAASLLLSVRRRLTLLGCPRSAERQLLLPLGDEDPLGDETPEDVLGATGLADTTAERRYLEEISRAAEHASAHESKLKCLVRLLSRISEPAVIFTEYRDTLAQIAAALPVGKAALVLHGAMTSKERISVQREFCASGALLLATDAASEGLNLHERCRLVIHFELPWTPMRLTQRTGRVDRLGQSRTVHELVLVANDTAERLVLAPLLKRARAASARGTRALSALDESAVATTLMDGVEPAASSPLPPPLTRTADLRGEADTEGRRLYLLRRLRTATTGSAPGSATDTYVTAPRRGAHVLIFVVSVSVEDPEGRVIHGELVTIRGRTGAALERWTSREVAGSVSRLIDRHGPWIRQMARDFCAAACDDAKVLYRERVSAELVRERQLSVNFPSASQGLVQAGLFERRAIVHARARHEKAALLSSDAEVRMAALRDDVRLHTVVSIAGVRLDRLRR
jgi:superfamily II DNA or RNA helicase